MALSNLKSKSFLTRAISGIVLVLIIAAMAFIGGYFMYGMVFAISLIGLFELYRVADMHKTPMAIVGYLATITYYIMIEVAGLEWFSMLVVGFMLLIMATYVFTFPNYSTEKVVMAFFGVLYVPVMMSFMYLVRDGADGIYTFWLIFICSWICDTCAYLTGVVCGKHKMAPVLSPKKTIEGAIGGIVGAALVGALYGFLVGNHLNNISNPTVLFAIIGAAGGLASMIGDLCASAIKRNYDIKDYGKLIPGHGGIMDRFDSVIVTAPMIYFLLVFFG